MRQWKNSVNSAFTILHSVGGMFYGAYLRVVGYNNKIHRNGIKRAVRKTEEDSAIIIDSR